MSEWTHVNGSIRIDSFRVMSPDINFKELFKACSFDDTQEKWDNCNVPCGSEGSLQFNIWVNPKENHLAAYTVNIFGDLRDYTDYYAIKEWFKDICLNKGLTIRNAILEVDTSLHERIFYYDYARSVIVEVAK